MKLKTMALFLTLFTASAFSAVDVERPITLKEGDKVAIIGDSITEQKQYTLIVETYLELCSGLKDIRVFQFGWSGERSPGFVQRMENDVAPWNPNVVTLLYGMNDGGYKEYDEKLAETYKENMEKIVQFFKSKKAQVIVGTPTMVDPATFRNKETPELAGIYNMTLKKFGDIGKRIAAQEQVTFCDVNALMHSVMERAKAKYGEQYHMAGDGFHPGPNGQLLIAEAFLSAMGMDGKIAQIVLNMNGESSVSNGHKIVGGTPGVLEIESIRYPYCFYGSGKKEDDPSNHLSILPFTGFQEKLNNFELKVVGLNSPKGEVKWGKQSKIFTAEELAKGINLAAEFPVNPFSEQFNKVYFAAQAKENYETWMIKSLITQKRTAQNYSNNDPDLMNAFEVLRVELFKNYERINEKMEELHIPINHTITVTPVQD